MSTHPSTAHLLRTGLAAALLCMTAALPAAAQNRTIERTFKLGGTAHLDLSAGQYRISASPDDQIRIVVKPTSHHSADAAGVRITVNAAGTRADVVVDGPLSNGVKVDIALPRRTHLVMDLSAGELTLKEIEGSKDITANAGELNIEIGDRERYRHVNASVRIGELRAAAFNVDKGGFFRSFDWEGGGSYDLRVKLMVGELRLN
jgi:hypothetical protein